MGLGHVFTISDKDQVYFSKFGQNFSEIYLLKLENVKYKISSLQESKGNSHQRSKSYSYRKSLQATAAIIHEVMFDIP